jgi:pimeloyl-ACP methyl ester carboxylesterase
MLVLGIILGVIAVLMGTGAILHATYYKKKLQSIKPYGQLVGVDGGQMHVFSMGRGEKTVVLLPGLGVALPCAEFSPLMRRLSQKYTAVCVEYFGVGFSAQTSAPRTCESYVEETRAALKAAGFEPPYVLMPHSISTVYSEYYAAKYPAEVEAIISLDGTSTAIYEEMPGFVKSMLSVAKFQQATGLTSILGPLGINKKSLLANGYTEKEIGDMVTFGGFTINDTSLGQIANSAEFIKQAMALPFPASVPYYKVISKKTYETPNPQMSKLGLTPQDYQRKHLERVGSHARYEVLDGTHFIYVNNAERIAQIAEGMLA